MSLNWADIILNGGSLSGAIEGDDGSALGNVDLAFQSAVIVSSTASLTINVAKPNLLIPVATVLSGTLAFNSAKLVLVSDYDNGKFSGTYGPYAFAADVCTIIGDICSIFGGAAALIGPDAIEASEPLNTLADFVTGAGLSLQLAYKQNGSVSSSLLSTLNGGISSLETFVSVISTALSNAGNSYSSEWNSAQTALLSMLNAISTAANNMNPSTLNAEVSSAITAITGFQSTISALFTSVITDNSALSSTTTDDQNAAQSVLVGSYQQSGLYVVQSGDTWSSIASSLAGPSIDADTLTRINAVFGITSISPGAILHVPVVSPLAGTPFEGLTSRMGLTEVFDPSTDTTYSVGGSLDGSTSGALIIDVPDSLGDFPTFNAGTYSGVTLNYDGTVSVTLSFGDPVALGTLTINTSTSAASLALTDGMPISLSSVAGDSVLTPSSSDTPEEALLAYLGDLGDSTTASALDTLNYDYQNPTGTAYTVGGEPDYIGHVDFTLDDSTPGAVITGDATTINVDDSPTTVTAYNILSTSVDLTQDTISNIQELYAGNVTLTGAEFNSFENIAGSDSNITIDSSGTYSLNTSQITGTVLGFTAGDWGGTTLIGNSTAGQTLTASLFGNDTLDAGNGSGDTLVAGEGVDTLVGGTGGDTFEALDGLADDSSITGSGSGNVLEASGDISGATISGVQTLDLEGSVTLNNTEFDGFSTIDAVEGNTITATTGGTYSLSGITVDGTINMYSDAGDTTTLTGNNADAQTLSAANSTGNDTLTAGSGNDDILDASGSTGTNTLTAGNGYYDLLIAGQGVDTLTGGTGEDTFEVDDGLASGSSITGNGSDNWLEANGDISAATISDLQTLALESGDGVDLTHTEFAEFTSIIAYGDNTITATTGGTYSVAGDSIYSAFTMYTDATDNTTLTGNSTDDQILSAAYSSGNDTLSVGDGAGDVLDATGSTGTDSLTAGNGAGDILIAGDGVGTLTGGTGGDTFIVGDGLASGSSITGNGSGNVLDASGDITAATISGVTTLDVDGAVTLTGSQFAAFSTIEGGGSITIDSAGTYSLSGVTVDGAVTINAAATGTSTLTGNSTADQTLSAAGSSGTVTLNAGSGADDALIAGSGTDTLNGGSGGDFLEAGTGVDTMDGGSSANWFGVYNSLASGSVLNGGSGDDSELQTGGTNIDITGATISNLPGLDVDGGVTLTESQLNGFGYIGSDDTSATIYAATTGGDDTYDISSTAHGSFNMTADVAGLTLIDNGANNETLTSSSDGGDTLSPGGGSGDIISALDSVGGDVIYADGYTTVNVGGNGESGTDDYVTMSDSTADGGSINIASNSHVDIYGAGDTIIAQDDDTIGIQDGNDNSLSAGTGGSIFVNSGDSDTITADDQTVYAASGVSLTVSGGGDLAYVASDDTVDITGNGEWGTDNYVVMSSGTMDVAGDAHADIYGGSNAVNTGAYSLVGVQDGDGNTISLGSNSDLFINSGTDDSITGGGSETYNFASTFGSDTINNGSGSTANGSVAFASGITDEDLWFKQSGNNLLIDLLGTSDQITIDNWYSTTGNQVASFAADGLTLDSQIATLISAMATYAAAHSGFNPQTATSMPTDTTLQSAIASSWHS